MSVVLGNFEITEEIASGGMGRVYKGIQLSLRRFVAIKQLLLSLAEDPQYITRFEREAITLASLSNENIVSIIDFGREDDSYYIVMEYVNGIPLTHAVSPIADMPSNFVLTIIENCARGLGYSHRKGVVHRDIKPANIMLSREGVIKITDFGLANPRQHEDKAITISGSIMGTPRYMSPEQARGDEIDHRSDIYSLGLVFYELLTGFSIISGKGFQDELLQAAEPKKPSYRIIDSEADKRLIAMIKKCLEPRPEDRYQNLSEMMTDIHQLRKKVAKYREPEILSELTQGVMGLPEEDAITISASMARQIRNDAKTVDLSEVSSSIARPVTNVSFWRYSGKLKDLDPDDYISRFQRFYIKPDVYPKIIKNIKANSSFLIKGRPAAGKTRALFQALSELHESHGDWQVLIPKTKAPTDEILIAETVNSKNVILIWDDIDQYISIWNPEDIFKQISKKTENLIIIGTVRSGEEFQIIENQKTEWLYFFQNQIELLDITDAQAIELAKGTGSQDISDFDGTPGSLVLDLNHVKSRYNTLKNPHRALLRTMKLLFLVNARKNKSLILTEVCEHFFGVKLSRTERRDALRYLIANSLVKRDGEGYQFYHDSYAEKVVTDYEIEDLSEDFDELVEIIGSSNDPYTMLSLSAYMLQHREFTLMADLCRKSIEIKPGLSKTHYQLAIALSFLGKFQDAMPSYDKAIELENDYTLAIYARGNAKNILGDRQGAINDYQRAIKLAEFPKRKARFLAASAIVYASVGDVEHAVKVAKKALHIDKKGSIYNIACLYSILSKSNPKLRDNAFKLLKEALKIHPEFIPFISKDKDLDPLRDDPRFAALHS